MIEWCSVFLQPPRPLTQTDLEKVLSTSKKTNVAAHEYTRLMAQSSSTWPIQKDGEDMPVQNMINELSKLVLAQMLNLQAENQDN